MKYRIRQNSLDAYRDVNITHDQAMVFNAIKVLSSNKKRGVTDHEIKDWLNNHSARIWEINQVNGRRNGLLNSGIIEADGDLTIHHLYSNRKTKRTLWSIIKLDWDEVKSPEVMIDQPEMELAL